MNGNVMLRRKFRNCASIRMIEMWLKLKQRYWLTRIFFGAEICPYCGSKNVIQRGYEGVNHRHDCKDCRVETRFDPGFYQEKR